MPEAEKEFVNNILSLFNGSKEVGEFNVSFKLCLVTLIKEEFDRDVWRAILLCDRFLEYEFSDFFGCSDKYCVFACTNQDSVQN